MGCQYGVPGKVAIAVGNLERERGLEARAGDYYRLFYAHILNVSTGEGIPGEALPCGMAQRHLEILQSFFIVRGPEVIVQTSWQDCPTSRLHDGDDIPTLLQMLKSQPPWTLCRGVPLSLCTALYTGNVAGRTAPTPWISHMWETALLSTWPHCLTLESTAVYRSGY